MPTRNGFDDVAGTIIGGDHKTGQLFLDGRAQGPQFHGDAHDEIRTAAAQSERLKTQCGPAEFERLYPQDSNGHRFELRIWD